MTLSLYDEEMEKGRERREKDTQEQSLTMAKMLKRQRVNKIKSSVFCSQFRRRKWNGYQERHPSKTILVRG